ncbi:MAG TPA: hypothetical protein VGR67_07130 [Candidatus Polarisedimenticolia bacterium]|jgi:hypothetical protein|nr:hypothetical protein [Candidatus Polarisedimenticolia bacterium]
MTKLKLAILVLLFVAVAAATIQFFAPVAEAKNCPSGGGCGCGTAYAPVTCHGCRYTNMCHARCAGFSDNDCKTLSPQ